MEAFTILIRYGAAVGFGWCSGKFFATGDMYYVGCGILVGIFLIHIHLSEIKLRIGKAN